MPRKKKHEEHVNLERWLVSYADFITLLFAFFVVMYGISSVNEGKYRILTDTLNTAFNKDDVLVEATPDSVEAIGDASLVSTDTAGGDSVMDMEYKQQVDQLASQQIANVSEQLENAFGGLIKSDEVNLTVTGDYISLQISSELLFSSANAELGDNAYPILEEIAAILKDQTNPIQVEGYTDNRPISTNLYPSNWELSAARAASVVSLLQAEGVAPQRMAAIGYGEYRPIADNKTATGRKKNRRVEMIILSDRKQAERLVEKGLQEMAPQTAPAIQ